MELISLFFSFLASSMDPVRARSHNNNNNNYPPSLGGPSRSNTVPGRNEVPGGDLMDIVRSSSSLLLVARAHLSLPSFASRFADEQPSRHPLGR